MDADNFISKTRRKRQMRELQDVGAALVKLSPEVIQRLQLPEALREAVLECKRFTKHEAIRRQMQYIGRIMRALEGTLDEEKVRRASENALIGDAAMITAQVRERFHPEDRLMLWFDFNNHDSARVIRNMEVFMQRVAPRFQ